MEEVKHWLASRTIIASAVGVIITLAQMFKVEALAGLDQVAVVDHLYNIAQAILYGIAIVGRVSATKAIKA